MAVRRGHSQSGKRGRGTRNGCDTLRVGQMSRWCLEDGNGVAVFVKDCCLTKLRVFGRWRSPLSSSVRDNRGGTNDEDIL